MNRTPRSGLPTRLATLAGAGLAAALALTACSSTDGPTTASSSTAASSNGSTSAGAEAANANPADVTFAQAMIPHHQQAVSMARLAQGRSTDAQVLDLAARIEAAQGPEIETLTGWLSTWSAPAEGMSEMDDAGGMDGMMSAQDMSTMETSAGTEFDREWLQLMIEHHTGAIGMAEVEIAEGQNPDAVALAQRIAASQNDEITEMEQLLQALPQS